MQHRAAFKMRSFLHESVFILLFIDSDNVSLHLDIAQVKTHFTQEPLVTTVSSVNLSGMCEKHRAASNLMSFRHESIFILLFTESHNGFLLFDIALVRAPFTRQSLVTNVSVKKKKSGRCP